MPTTSGCRPCRSTTSAAFVRSAARRRGIPRVSVGVGRGNHDGTARPGRGDERWDGHRREVARRGVSGRAANPFRLHARPIASAIPKAEIEIIPNLTHYTFLARCNLWGKVVARSLCADLYGI